MEICRNAGGDAPASASEAEARRIESERMATVSLRNVKKIYPFVSGENKKKKKKDDKEDVCPTNVSTPISSSVLRTVLAAAAAEHC